MYRTMYRNARLAAVGACLVLALSLSPVAAFADGGDDLIDADLTASNVDDPPINGVGPGGAPWIIDRGEVRVRDDGRMEVRIEGLQIPAADGSASNPVASINAVLYCGGQPVANSGPQPMSVPEGDARFRVELQVPEHCDMATVLISPTQLVGVRFIASAVAEEEDD
jgi:hypothetical protein